MQEYIVLPDLVSLKVDVLQKFGYKKTLSAGLILSAVGSFLFIPAATMESFPFFLTALFTVGLGFSIQQIVANPLAIKMGSPVTGAHRLTLAGGVNSFGTTIGAILLGIALFGMGDSKQTTLSLEDIKLPFIILGCAFILGVIIYAYFAHLDREKYFDEGKTLYTVGEVVNYDYTKKRFNVYYTYLRNGVLINDISTADNAANNSVYRKHISNVDKMKNLVIGKKFFVKFSVEKPEYAEIYFNLPVHEEFQYQEGQTWKKPLKRSVAKLDVYGNYR